MSFKDYYKFVNETRELSESDLFNDLLHEEHFLDWIIGEVFAVEYPYPSKVSFYVHEFYDDRGEFDLDRAYNTVIEQLENDKERFLFWVNTYFNKFPQIKETYLKPRLKNIYKEQPLSDLYDF
jgi:hypothetical protein